MERIKIKDLFSYRKFLRSWTSFQENVRSFFRFCNFVQMLHLSFSIGSNSWKNKSWIISCILAPGNTDIVFFLAEIGKGLVSCILVA